MANETDEKINLNALVSRSGIIVLRSHVGKLFVSLVNQVTSSRESKSRRDICDKQVF